MTNKMPKPAYQMLLGFLMLTFTVVACNNKKEGDKKEPAPDSLVVKPQGDDTAVPPPAPPDTPKMKGPEDTIKKKPVKDPG